MANAVYPLFKTALLTGEIVDLTTDVVKVALIDTASYSYSASDEFMSDIASGAVVAITPALTTPTVVDAAFDSDDPTFSSVTGNECEAIILFIDTGEDATSRLIAYQDTNVSGLPITPNGGDITITVDAAGWFVL